MTQQFGGKLTRSFLWGPAGLIVAGYLLLGVLYASVTPIFENGDEEYHFQYALELAQGRGLPVTGASDLGQIAGHPPLYYMVGTLLVRWVDTGDLEGYFRQNPHAQLTRFDLPDNKNRFIHTNQEAFPYHGTALAVQLLRYLSLAFGAVTVVFSGLIAQQVLPLRPGARWTAMCLTACLPQFLVVSTAARNDAAIVALTAVALWIMVRMLRQGVTARQVLALGIVSGLAALAKTSGLLLAGAAIGFVVWQGWRKTGGRELLRLGLLVTGPVLLIAGWWYVRNWLLYGDPVGTQAMLAITGARSYSPWQVITSSEPFVWSWWGTAGWFDIALPQLVYWLLDGLAILLFVGAGRWAWRNWRAGDHYAPLMAAGLVLWVLVTYLAVVAWAQHAPLGYDGRLALPALPAFAVLMTLGLTEWVPVQWESWVVGPLLGLWAGLALVFPLLYIGPAFARPRLLTQSQLPSQLIQTSETYGDELQLLGLQVEPPTAQPGETVTTTLYWQALKKPSRAYSVVLSLLGRDGQVLAHRDTYPGQGNYPTDLWEAGQIVADEYQLQLIPEAIVPNQMQIFLGLRQFETNVTLDPPPGIVPVAALLNVVPRVPESAVGQPALATFGDQIVLLGYHVTPTTAQAGQVLDITLDWTATQKPAEDFTIFTHLVDAQGQLAGQMDRQPANGGWPTTRWVPNQVWHDHYTLPITAVTVAGPAHLEIGFYRLADGSRLPLAGGGDAFQFPIAVQLTR